MMPLLSKEEFLKTLPAKARLLGLDVGQKTFGIALSDETRSIATPLKTIFRKKLKEDMHEIKQIIQDYTISGMIVGWPLNMDGSEGPRCQATKDLINTMIDDYALQTYTDDEMPVLFWDERLSTHAMEKSLIREHDTNRKKRKILIDQLAAQFFLQSFLDTVKIS